MLRSYRSYKTVVRVYKIAVFLDLSHIPGPHLAHKYLVRRLKELSDGDNDAHRSIVALRCNKHSVSLPQQCLKVELNARLAITSGNAYDGKIRILLQDALRVVYIMVVHAFFYRAVYLVGDHDHDLLKSGKQKKERSQRECFHSFGIKQAHYRNKGYRYNEKQYA